MDRINTIPNAFYDLIVFVAPTLILGLGGLIGFKGVEVFSEFELSELNTLGVIVALLVVLVASYEYGRIAETWSAVVVQTPLRWIAKRTPLLSSPDFLAGHPHALDTLHLEGTFDGRPADKWVIYFYAFVAYPSLGSDLLKRYAWEKLSRSAAFSYAVLSVASVAFAIIGAITPRRDLINGTGSFGSWQFTATVITLMVATAYEYYRRNVWNFDLLSKITPVLLKAYELTQNAGTRIVVDGASVSASARSQGEDEPAVEQNSIDHDQTFERPLDGEV